MDNNQTPTLRRAIVLTTGSSLAVPLAGLLTQPLLAQSLGVEGRGEVAAAIAPSALIVAVATLGLPEALTYLLAKRPELTRRAVVFSVVVSGGLATICAALTWLALPFISSGNSTLASYVLIGIAATAPTLAVGTLRGAASGRQEWGKVAAERVTGSTSRLFAIALLWGLDDLTVQNAVIVSVVSPFLGGLAYASVLYRKSEPLTITIKDSKTDRVAGQLLSFGSKIWLGAVAEMFLGRVGQVFMAPLSNIRELGLYSVSSTIADVPLIAALAIQSASFGVNSKAPDVDKLCATSRFTLLVGIIGCALIGSTIPLWIAPIFGPEFLPALTPTLLILLSVLFCIPGLLAASGISAWGRPALRSIGLTATLATYIALFLLLVPRLGVYGACLSGIIANVTMTCYMTFTASSLMRVRPHKFFLIQLSDLQKALSEIRRLYPTRPKRP